MKKNKLYIVFNKETGLYKGNEFLEETALRKIKEDEEKSDEYFETAKNEHRIIRDYRNCDVIEEEEENWKNHIKTNPQITKIEEVEEIEDEKGKKVKKGKLKAYLKEKTLEELKTPLINKRKIFMQETRDDWVFDIENMPLEIKNKYNLARDEIKEIELIENKDDLINYNNFED